ncbi:hypothetical protein D6C97_05930 [Aureobasidium pullulans]|nr:hypothetical protein D6C97_05930 [Aureobasidium pullulans]
MPSSSPLDPKATIFVSEVPSKPAGKLNPNAAVFVPAPKAPVFEATLCLLPIALSTTDSTSLTSW